MTSSLRNSLNEHTRMARVAGNNLWVTEV